MAGKGLVGDAVWVLIHSPVLGPTSWARVASELERRNHHAIVPSFLGLADAPSPRWRHYPATARAATEGIAEPVILVGHSGAAPILPAIADALISEVAGLVFVDALAPPATSSAPSAPPEQMQQLRALASGGVLPPWSAWFGEDVLRELLPDEGLRASLEQEMPRLPLACFEESIPMPDGWNQRPAAYLLLSADHHSESAAVARSRGWPVVEVEGGHHLSLVTDPTAVTAALLQLERQL